MIKQLTNDGGHMSSLDSKNASFKEALQSHEGKTISKIVPSFVTNLSCLYDKLTIKFTDGTSLVLVCVPDDPDAYFEVG
jgi:hypothetical protein